MSADEVTEQTIQEAYSFIAEVSGMQEVGAEEEIRFCDLNPSAATIKSCIDQVCSLTGVKSDCDYKSDGELDRYDYVIQNGNPMPLNEQGRLAAGMRIRKARRRGNKPDAEVLAASVDPKYGPIPADHYLTHNPKHPACPICRLAKPQAAPFKRVSDKKNAHVRADGDGNFVKARKLDSHAEPKKFGDLITADHMICNKDDPVEVRWLDRVLLVVQDKATTTIWGGGR